MAAITGVKELIPQRIVMRIRVNVHKAFSTFPAHIKHSMNNSCFHLLLLQNSSEGNIILTSYGCFFQQLWAKHYSRNCDWQGKKDKVPGLMELTF